MTEKAETRGMTKNLLKVRDDHSPMLFERSESEGRYRFCSDAEVEWAPREFGTKELRGRIEPWLTSLFQSDHLSLLAGSGLTHAVHQLATGRKASGMNKIEFSIQRERITTAAEKSAKEAGRESGNFEDQLRVANELLRGMEILEDAQTESLRTELLSGMKSFASSILANEAAISSSEGETREKALNTLVTFLMSFASRIGTRDRLSIFTTNYDRLLELGAELAGLHLLDRFIGQLMPIFRSSRLDIDMHYNPPGIRGEPRYLEGVARFTKLHGSVDWINTDKDIRRIGLPFGATSADPYLVAPGPGKVSAYEMMIYPNAAKDREAAEYPYVDLFRDFAGAICRPNSTLVAYGYSFGDEHINRSIRDMLTIPSTHLVVIAYDDPLGRIMKVYDELGRPSQISLLIGPELAELTVLTQNFLPKAAIDRATSRMSELLRQRLGSEHGQPKAGDKASDTQDGAGQE